MNLYALLSILIFSTPALVHADGPTYVLAESHCRKMLSTARQSCKNFGYYGESSQRDQMLLGMDEKTLEDLMNGDPFREDFRFEAYQCPSTEKFVSLKIQFVHDDHPLERRCRLTRRYWNEDKVEMVKIDIIKGDTREISQPAMSLAEYEKAQLLIGNAIPPQPKKKTFGETVGDFFSGWGGGRPKPSSGR